MNRTTAQRLLVAYAEVEDALDIIRKRQEKVGDREYNANPDAFADFRYFGDKLAEALKGIQHRIGDAQMIVVGKTTELKAVE